MIKRLFIVGICIFTSNLSEAVVAFRSASHNTGATAANITGSEPTGAALNDILIAILYIESDTAVTAPSGWTNTFAGTAALAENNSASGAYREYAYWIRRGGSAPALAWTFSSSFRSLSIVAYSGAATSGDPFSFLSTAVRDDGTSSTYPSISGTTLVSNEMLIWMVESFNTPTGAITVPSGFIQRVVAPPTAANNTDAAEKAQAVAGATGAITGGLYASGGNGTTSALLVGLEPPGAAASGTVCPSMSMLGVGCQL